MERLFCWGAPAPGELKQGRFSVTLAEDNPPRDKLGDAPSGGGEGLPGSTSAP